MTVTSGGTMNKQAWTPGPWKAAEWSCHATTTIISADSIGEDSGILVIAECSGYGRHTDESLADAKLIAKAPQSTLKLLEFYEAAKSWHSVHGHTRDSVQCDEFCRLMNEAEPILHEAGALALNWCAFELMENEL